MENVLVSLPHPCYSNSTSDSWISFYLHGCHTHSHPPPHTHQQPLTAHVAHFSPTLLQLLQNETTLTSPLQSVNLTAIIVWARFYIPNCCQWNIMQHADDRLPFCCYSIRQQVKIVESITIYPSCRCKCWLGNLRWCEVGRCRALYNVECMRCLADSGRTVNGEYISSITLCAKSVGRRRG